MPKKYRILDSGGREGYMARATSKGRGGKPAPKNAQRPVHVSKGVQRGRLNASAKTWAALDKGAQRAGTTARPPRTAPGSGGGGLGARWARLTGGAWRGSK